MEDSNILVYFQAVSRFPASISWSFHRLNGILAGFDLISYMCGILLVCITVHLLVCTVNMCVQCSQTPEEGIKFLLKLELQMMVRFHEGAGN